LYSGGRELGNFAIKYAEETLNELEKTTDHRLSGRVEIICYNSLSDLKQSNFGLEELAQNTGGYTQVLNNKIYIYFDGDHQHFTQQLREGISLILLNELLYGGSLQDRLSNAALLNLPEWFLRGLTSYLAKPWDSEMDNTMKDAMLLPKKNFAKFNRQRYRDPVFAGHSMWKYLVDKYEPQAISNILYLTRLTRNFESALEYVTGKRFKEIQKDWFEYYKNKYIREDNFRTLPETDLKIKRRIAQYLQPQMRVSPKGDKLAFTTNKNGKYKVWLFDVNTSKIKKVFKGGQKYNQLEIDKSFPLIAWLPGGDKLAYLFEKKGVVRLNIEDLVTKKSENFKFLKFDKITGIDFAENSKTIVLSAIRKGQSDIFMYDLNTKRERQLTFDFYDDKNPRFADYSSKILFSSNRLSDSLGASVSSLLDENNNFDVFVYDLETNSQKLKRLTLSPGINETNPSQFNRKYYSYLTDYNGIVNRYASRVEEQYDYTQLVINYLDSLNKESDTLRYKDDPDWGASTDESVRKKITTDFKIAKSIDTTVFYKDVVFTYPLTNYKRNILAHDVAAQTQMVFDLVFEKNKYRIISSPVSKSVESDSKTIETNPTMYRLNSGLVRKAFVSGPAVLTNGLVEDTASVVAKIDSVKKIDSSAYFFITDFTPSGFARPGNIYVPKTVSVVQIKKPFKLAAPRFYNTTYFADEVVTQIDNSIINTYYQPISPVAAQMFNPGFNAMFKVGMIDLFEDYRFTGGVRLSVDLSGFDYFLSFETLKKRLDHKFIFYRQNRTGGSTEQLSLKNQSHELRYIIKFPFDPVNSIRLNIFGRQDRDIIRTTNIVTATIPDRVTNWTGAKLEYIFDNTIPKGLNLDNGTKFKLFFEKYINIDDNSVKLNALGFDFRHYEKIHRQIVFANRFSANTSFGSAKVVYYLGGVENWMTPSFNNDFITSSDQNFVFQALACNMRGFIQNIRNGNSFAVLNSELRIPIFQYAFNRPLRSNFLNNLQLMPFFDLGTAWMGSNPYSDDNTFNQKIIEQGAVKAKVINVRDPIVAGYGAGIRSKLFGYFIRFDVAWGIQDGERNKDEVYYLSLGLDF